MDEETKKIIEGLYIKVEELEKTVKDMQDITAFPNQFDDTLKYKGFIKESIFVGGFGTLGANGEFRQVIPNSSIKSVALASTISGGTIETALTQGYENNTYGGASTQFDITNPAGTTYRYTYDGTGTNPNINGITIPVGSRLTILGDNFNIGNNVIGAIVTGSGSNYFEIDNSGGIVESNKTLGSGGSITGGKPAPTRELYVQGTALTTFAFVVFLLNDNITTL